MIVELWPNPDRIEVDGYPPSEDKFVTYTSVHPEGERLRHTGQIRMVAHGMLQAWNGSLTVKHARTLIEALEKAVQVAEGKDERQHKPSVGSEGKSGRKSAQKAG